MGDKEEMEVEKEADEDEDKDKGAQLGAKVLGKHARGRPTGGTPSRDSKKEKHGGGEEEEAL